MKIIYECETCREQYKSTKACSRCEAHSTVDPATYPPVGLMAGDPGGCGPGPKCATNCGNHLCGTGFIWVVSGVGVDPYWKHGAKVGFADFRGNGAGDTYNFHADRYTKYDPFPFGPQHFHRDANGVPEVRTVADWVEAELCDAMMRAVAVLKAIDIPPTLMRHGKIVAAHTVYPSLEDVPPKPDDDKHSPDLAR